MRFLIYILLSLLLSSCHMNFFGTNTGNPGIPSNGSISLATIELVGAVCNQVTTCFPSANFKNCYDQVWTVTGYTSQLGATASTYATMTNLLTAESNAIVAPNYINLQNCESAISQLSCTSTLVTESYSASLPSSYSQTNLLFQAKSACQQVF